MTTDRNKERIEKISNQIRNWWAQTKFQNPEKADRMLPRFRAGPEKYICPYMAKDFSEDASANWERIKQKHGLTTQGERDQNISYYEEKAQRHYDQRTEEQHQEQSMRPKSSEDDKGSIYYLGDWGIHNAIREDWTPKERKPPEESGYSEWLTVMNLALSDKLNQVVEHVCDEYGYTKQTAIRRLLRYGTQEVIRFIQEETVHGDASLAEYRAAGKRAARSVRGASHGYTSLDEKVKVETNFGTRLANNQSYKIVWNQKKSIGWIATQLGITEADAFRWSLTVAGKALHEEADLPPALGEDIEEIATDVQEFAIEKGTKIIESSKIAILEAFDEGYGTEIAEYCTDETPHVWREFVSTIGKTYRELERVDPKLVLLTKEVRPERRPRVLPDMSTISPPPKRTPVLPPRSR